MRFLKPAAILSLTFFCVSILSIAVSWGSLVDRCSLKARTNASGNFDILCNGSCNGDEYGGCAPIINFFPGGLFIVCKCPAGGGGGYSTPNTPCTGYALSTTGGTTWILDCGKNTCANDCFVNPLINEEYSSVCVCPS